MTFLPELDEEERVQYNYYESTFISKKEKKIVQSNYIQSVLHNKTPEIYLKVFFETYLRQYFGLDCMVKINVNSDIVYPVKVFNKRRFTN